MVKNFYKAKKLIILIIVLFFMLVFVLYPDKYIPSTISGIKLFAFNVLPSLLPFFFLTALITKFGSVNKLSSFLTKPCNVLFKQNGLCAYTFLMSILSGYPIGSKIIYDLYKSNLINESEASKMSALCSTSGPLFVVGTVGVCMFNSKIVGFIIYFSHILSALINGIVFRNYGDFSKNNLAPLQAKVDNVLYESIYSSVISCLIVGGFVSIFYVFADILQDFQLLLPFQKVFYFLFSPFSTNQNLSRGFIVGLIECTKGLKFISSLKLTPFSIALSCGIISFGGISIILQSIIYLNKSGVKTWFFILAKLNQMLTSIIICFLLSSFLL